MTSYKDYIIIIGGIMPKKSPYAGIFYVNTNQIMLFNPIKNTVHQVQTKGSNVPQSRHAHSACVYKNKLIIFGGDDEKGGGASFGANIPMSPTDEVASVSLDTIEFLSVEWQHIRSGDRLRYARSYHTAHIYEDYMYVYGGESGPTRAPTNNLIRFDLNNSNWSTCQVSGSLPGIEYQEFGLISGYKGAAKRQFSVLHQRKIYVAENESVIRYNEFHVVDMETLKWERIQLKQPEKFITFLAMQNVGSDIFLFGKKSSGNDFLVYNTEDDTENPCAAEGEGPDTQLKVICHQNKLFFLDNGRDTNLYSLSIGIANKGDGLAIDKANFINDMRGLLLDKKYVDVTFEVEGKQLTAHKNILAARCKYFENMFKSSFTEPNATKMEIADVKATTFEALLEFIYCNELKLDYILALDLLDVSVKYSFPQLKNVCSAFLTQQLSLDNFGEIAKASEEYEAVSLREAVVQFVITNRQLIAKREDYEELSKPLLWEIIFKLGKK